MPRVPSDGVVGAARRTLCQICRLVLAVCDGALVPSGLAENIAYSSFQPSPAGLKMPPMNKPSIEIGFLIYPGVTQLDATAPAQVLSRVPGARTHFVWKSLEPVATD